MDKIVGDKSCFKSSPTVPRLLGYFERKFKAILNGYEGWKQRDQIGRFFDKILGDKSYYKSSPTLPWLLGCFEKRHFNVKPIVGRYVDTFWATFGKHLAFLCLYLFTLVGEKDYWRRRSDKTGCQQKLSVNDVAATIINNIHNLISARDHWYIYFSSLNSLLLRFEVSADSKI